MQPRPKKEARMDRRQRRVAILTSYGAGEREVEELLAYDENPFDPDRLPADLQLPLPPEPDVAAWRRYAAEADGPLPAEAHGAFVTLQRYLPQLHFPIRAGISQTEAYRAATLRGEPVEGMAEATGLSLERPDELRLIVHDSPAGPVPVLIPAGRTDFVLLVQACTKRNEPEPVPASMGSCTVKGFNNWDRIREYRQAWEARQASGSGEADWDAEFQRLIPHRELYQDRFLILSDGPYSDVPAAELGLEEETWRRTSLSIRMEHECAHYFTLRVFGVMRNNLLDETIADYMGITAAAGRYRADWFLRFMGLESFPEYREGGRLQNYRGQPPLSDGAFKVVQAMVTAAAENLERFDARGPRGSDTPRERARVLLALCRLTLEELAAPEAVGLLEHALAGQNERST
jgi:hypothetical protein